MENVLVIGYGSIGKRHVANLISLGVKPYISTAFPEERNDVYYVRSFEEVPDTEKIVIASPTARHLTDFEQIVRKTRCKSVLIEKPVEASVSSAEQIKRLASRRKIQVSVGYNMRFLKVFDLLRGKINSIEHLIRMVNIVAGQYLPEWRPEKPYQQSYSAHRRLGGGVDLDLSHEIDYMLWLFGSPERVLYTWNGNTSSLEIDSPDLFKGLYKYPHFLVDVALDYFRKRQRTLEFIGENRNIGLIDFISGSCQILDETSQDKKLFDWNQSYVEELKEFLGITHENRLCTLADAIDVLKLMNLQSQ